MCKRKCPRCGAPVMTFKTTERIYYKCMYCDYESNYTPIKKRKVLK